MAKPRLAAEIVVGSIWPGRNGGYARVVGVTQNRSTAGFVTFRREDGSIEFLQQWRFHERYLEPFDARRIRSQFSMSLSNLVSFHAFFSVSTRKMFARSASISPDDCSAPSRGRPALPHDAVFVGTYAEPVSADHFFEDLHYLFDRLVNGQTVAM